MTGRRAANALAGALLVLAASQSMAAAAENGAASEVIAKLGKTEFDATALRDFVASLTPQARKQALADPQTMNRLVGLELARIAVLNEAKAKNWQRRPDVRRQIDKASDEAIVTSYLVSLSEPPEGFPSEAEIKKAYDLNRDSFIAPRQYRLQQIFIASPAAADKKAADAAQKKAADLARQARAPTADFAALARANSQHRPSADKGGDLGWAAQNEIVPEILKQVAGMAKGEISDPIRVAGGWHIVRLVDTKPAAIRPLAEVRDSIVTALRQSKRQEMQRNYIARVLDATPVAVNEARLRKLFQDTP